MKKSWIIVLAFVFLWSAVPAFSVPVPSELCLLGSEPEFFALILETKGEIGDVEFFDVSGWWMHGGCECISLIKGGAHRRNRKKLHLGLTGVFDEGGPGGGGDIYQAGFDVSYNLKKEKGDYSYIYIWDEEPPVKAFTETSGESGTGTLIEIDCSEGPEPPW
jgi:hypothetical protein